MHNNSHLPARKGKASALFSCAIIAVPMIVAGFTVSFLFPLIGVPLVTAITLISDRSGRRAMARLDQECATLDEIHSFLKAYPETVAIAEETPAPPPEEEPTRKRFPLRKTLDTRAVAENLLSSMRNVIAPARARTRCASRMRSARHSTASSKGSRRSS